MSKFVVVIFFDRTRAYEGVHALEELHEQGNATVYGTIVLERNLEGIRHPMVEGPLGLGVGTLAGALVGLLGGPIGVAVGAATGAVAGGFRDYLHAEANEAFIEAIERELHQGDFAVLAEVSEELLAPLDERIAALGGRIIRQWRLDAIDYLFEKKAQAGSTNLARLRAEVAAVKAQWMEERLEAKLEGTRRSLARTGDQLEKRLDDVKDELQAKLSILEEQAEHADRKVRARIDERVAALRRDLEDRERRLSRACERAREALKEA